MTPDSAAGYPEGSAGPPEPAAELQKELLERKEKSGEKSGEKSYKRAERETCTISNPVSKPQEIQPLGRLPLWIGTAGGFGYAPIAPGTFGSAAGCLLFLGLAWLDISLPVYAAAVVAVAVVGIWASDRCEKLFERKDDGRIVIDEVAGQLITLTPLLVVQSDGVGATSFAWWALVVTGFVVFRVLDIWKPGPVRWAERNFEGGLGVMADDLLAGVFGGLLLTATCIALAAMGSR